MVDYRVVVLRNDNKYMFFCVVKRKSHNSSYIFLFSFIRTIFLGAKAERKDTPQVLLFLILLSSWWTSLAGNDHFRVWIFVYKGMSFRYPKTAEELEKLLRQHEYGVFGFWAVWCGLCKRVTPKLEALAKEYPRAVFAHVNVDRIIF